MTCRSLKHAGSAKRVNGDSRVKPFLNARAVLAPGSARGSRPIRGPPTSGQSRRPLEGEGDNT